MKLVLWILIVFLSVSSASSLAAENVAIQFCKENKDCQEGTFCGYECRGGVQELGLTIQEHFSRYCTGFCMPLYGKRNKKKVGPSGDITNSAGKIVFKRKSLLTTNNLHMNWLTAKNWCLAQGKDLVDIKDNRLDCAVPQTEEEKESLKYACLWKLPRFTHGQYIASRPIRGLYDFLNSVGGYYDHSFWTGNWGYDDDLFAKEIYIGDMRRGSQQAVWGESQMEDMRLPLCE